ncbi:MAG: ATP-binding protein [Patescibacteria group bacterium]
MDKKIIKRQLFDQIKAHVSHKEITLVVGPRQVGKTTLLKLVEEDLRQEGKKTLFLNLDVESDRAHVISQEALVQYIRLSFGEERGYVFIDEAQRKEDAGRFFKGIYDMDLPYKLLLSGSGSLELKEKIHESMAGRKRVFELLPVTFEEFAAFRTDYRYNDRLMDFFRTSEIETNSLLNEYLQFGGYPGVILCASAKEKLQLLVEIYQSYLVRDISFLLGVEKTDAFTHLVRLLASTIGNLVSVSELSSTLGISAQTVKKYLWYLEQTYIIARVSPYFRNARTELSKMPVYYFSDLGLRNLSAHVASETVESDGFLFENFVFSILRERFGLASNPIHFWRSKGGAEVDFVLQAGAKLIPIEVKSRSGKNIAMSRSLTSFIHQYRPERAFIVTKNHQAQFVVGDTPVEAVPFYELLEKNFIGGS